MIEMKYLHDIKARCFIVIIGLIGILKLSAREAISSSCLDSLNCALEEARQAGDSLAIWHDLALLYQTVGRDEDAIVAFKEGKRWLDEEPTTLSRKMRYVSDMLVSTLQVNKQEESQQLLREYESLLKQQTTAMTTSDTVLGLMRHKKMIHAFHAELYRLKGEMEKARRSLSQAAEYDCMQCDDESADFIYLKIRMKYEMETGNYQAALVCVDKALALNKQVKLMKVKVDLLRQLNRETDALQLYKEMLVMNSKAGNAAFERQISQLRQLNDLNGQEERAHELARQSERLVLQQRRLVATVSFSLISLVLIYVLGLYYRRVQHLKNELLCERNSLVESEKQLRLMTEQAETANQMKTAFISNISHEIRTPLNPIAGFSELLLDPGFDEPSKRDFAQIISRNTEWLLSLVNDVLDLSRLESGKIQFTIRPVDIIACSREVFDDTVVPVPEKVSLTFTSAVESYILLTDRYRIQQLLSNLLSNAVKFTEEGEINLTVEVDEKQSQVRWIVTDTGCGIKPEQQEKIFEHFEKLNEFVQGTGLGLPICKIIAQRLSGSLFIDPAYTQGARFVFIHPLNVE